MPSSSTASSSSWPQPAVLSTIMPTKVHKKVVSTSNGDNKTDSNSQEQQQQQQQQQGDDDTFRVLALYKFVSPLMSRESLPLLQSEIESVCRQHRARGTLLLAEEGINGTICYPFFDTMTEKEERDGSPLITNKTADHDNDDGSHHAVGCQRSEEDDGGDTLLWFLQEKFDHSLRIRISKADRPAFARLKVRIKSEIVTMHGGSTSNGCADSSTNNNKDQDEDEGQELSACHPTQLVGEYVKPQDWNELLLDPDTLVIDTRNEYEIDVGTFRNAINPHTQSFVEFPNWIRQYLSTTNLTSREDDDEEKKERKDVSKSGSSHTEQQQQQQSEEQPRPTSMPKKIAMFCTGGIRCEKATNVCLQLVPSDIPVYHLEGGILAYLDEIPPDESLFDGDCYVFDQRVALTYSLRPSSTYKSTCHGCRHPLSDDDVQHADYRAGISCRYCSGKLSEQQQQRFAQRQRQMELAMKEGRPHIFDPKELSRRL